MRHWFRTRADQDFADEIEAHVALETDRLVANGMTREDAHAAATRAFGNRGTAQERFHESRGRVLLEQLAQDLRYAARAMRRSPGFALVATLCLAVGISVNTTAFSVLNAIFFRDFPGVVRQGELVGITIGYEASWGRSSASYASWQDWELLQSDMPAFTGMGAFNNLALSVRVSGDPQATRGALVSSNYFELLGTRPAAGRFMSTRDDPRELDRVVVVSHRFWTRELGARANVAGTVITIGTRAFTVIGVAPEGFFGLSPGEIIDPDIGTAELFIPLEAAPFLRAESAHTAAIVSARASAASATVGMDDRWLQVFGRLRPGATIVEAKAQVNVIASRLATAYPVERRKAFAEVSTGGNTAKDVAEMLAGMFFVMVVPAIILLVACANLANQLLARAIQRSREIAVRRALGATRARVVRQLVVESMLLACGASLAGVLLARWLLDGIRTWVLAIPFSIAIDIRVMLFTVGLALLTALVFGLAPALRATRNDLTHALKDGAPGSGQRRSRLRNALVVVQIAASLALIAVSSVFARTAERPPSTSLDAIADRALLVSMNLDLVGFDSVSGHAFQQRVMQRLSALPGVAAVGMAPFTMFEMLREAPMEAIGSGARTGENRWRYYDLLEVSGAWFEATNTSAVRGRLPTVAETRASPTVAVVDEVFARKMWGANDPIGQTVRIGDDSSRIFVTIVGIVPNRQEVSFRQPEGYMAIAGTRQYSPKTLFYVRTRGAAAAMIGIVREAAGNIDPRIPILWVRTMEEVGALEVSALTMVASGLVSLGTVALALAALGLFGVLSFIVAQRRYEIGIRMALGARSMDVTWMVLKQSLRLGMAGVAAGAFLSFVVVTGLRVVIHGVKPLDLLAFVGMSMIMVTVALLASVVPARRAASVDPMEALRAE